MMFFFLIIFLLVSFRISAQKGYPFISHFSFNEVIDYDNYDITEDNHNNILTANRKGILVFDSRNWELIPVDGFPVIIKNDPVSELVFAGTRQGFGFVSRNEKGQYTYRNICNRDSSFETENIFIAKDKVFFTGKNEIRFTSRHDPGALKSWKFTENNELQGVVIHNNELFFLLEKTGLFKTDADTFKLVRGDPYIRQFIVLYSSCFDSSHTVIASADNKVFLFDGDGFKEIYLEDSVYLKESLLTGVLALPDEKIALSTLMGGCIIADSKTGKTEYIINSRTGLPDDEIFAMNLDRNKGLWLCHAKGLSRIDPGLPIAGYSCYPGLEGDLLSAAWFNNSLFVGTTEGLYRLTEKREYSEKIITIKSPLKKIPSISEDDNQVDIKEEISTTDPEDIKRLKFKERLSAQRSQSVLKIIGNILQKKEDAPEVLPPEHPIPVLIQQEEEIKKKRIYSLQSISHNYTKIDLIRGKCKELVVIDGHLLASTNNGLFEIKGNKAKVLIPGEYITFLERSEDSKVIYAGITNGAKAIRPSGSEWITIADFSNAGFTIYSVARSSDSVWYLGSDNSVWITKTGKENSFREMKQFHLDLEYSDPVRLKKINDTIYLFLSSAVLQMKDTIIEKIRSFPDLNSIPRYYLNNNTVWIRSKFKWENFGSHDKLDYNGLPGIFNNVQYLFTNEQNEVWLINNNRELYKINPDKFNPVSHDFNVYISMISGDNKHFPLVFPEIDHNKRSLKITFAAPWYISPATTEYRYYIEGLNKTWGNWTYSQLVEYPVLPSGKFTLFVQARNSIGDISREASLGFIIKPPFWETTWFFVLSGLIIISLFFLIMQIRHSSLLRAKRILEERVRERTQEIERQKNEITEQKKEITDSINYAKQIQSAVLPSEKVLLKNMPDHFALFLPRDIVSGDFYWYTSAGDITVIAVADCTGHGVPGAFMSMLGISFLNEIVPKSKMNNAAEILNLLRNYVNETLSSSGEQEHSRDGMDIALCIINRKKSTMDFAGAFNSLIMFRDNELFEIKADKMPIGRYEKNDPFTNHHIKINASDVFYIFSDGFIDQFGGEHGKKFLSRPFKNLLHSIHSLPMQKQKSRLAAEFENWKGQLNQVDDVMIIGFRI